MCGLPTWRSGKSEKIGGVGERRPLPLLLGPLGGGQPRVEGGIVVGVEARDGLARRGIGRGDHASSPTTATAKSVVLSGPPTSRVRCAGSPRMARSDERRVGKAFVSTCRSRWAPDH